MGLVPNWNEPPRLTPVVLANAGPMAELLNEGEVDRPVPNEKRCGAVGDVCVALVLPALGEGVADPNVIGFVVLTPDSAGFSGDLGVSGGWAAGIGTLASANENPPAGTARAGGCTALAGACDSVWWIKELVDLPAKEKPPLGKVGADSDDDDPACSGLDASPFFGAGVSDGGGKSAVGAAPVERGVDEGAGTGESTLCGAVSPNTKPPLGTDSAGAVTPFGADFWALATMLLIDVPANEKPPAGMVGSEGPGLSKAADEVALSGLLQDVAASLDAVSALPVVSVVVERSADDAAASVLAATAGADVLMNDEAAGPDGLAVAAKEELADDAEAGVGPVEGVALIDGAADVLPKEKAPLEDVFVPKEKEGALLVGFLALDEKGDGLVAAEDVTPKAEEGPLLGADLSAEA